MTSIVLQEIKIHFLKMKLKSPFVTSIGNVDERSFMVIEARDVSGVVGWGECVAFETPWYNPETQDTCLAAMRDVLIPFILEKEISHPDAVFELFSFLEGNHMAKAAIEGAVWDIYAKLCGVTLSQALGGREQDIFVGVSIGLQENDEKLFAAISEAVNVGYKRIKLKVEIDKDFETLEKVLSRFPDIPLMIDANGAYRSEDISQVAKLDQFDLMMIEQPFKLDEWDSHVTLSSMIKTPICLDESIDSFDACVQAVTSGACKIITIKPSRVGGLSQAKKIHDYCYERGMPVWCGGMLESGIGRAQNIALASLPGFIIAGDISASDKYWNRDIIVPEVEVSGGKVVSSGYEVGSFEEFVVRECLSFT